MMIEDIVETLRNKSFELVDPVVPNRKFHSYADARAYVSELIVFDELESVGFIPLSEKIIKKAYNWKLSNTGIVVHDQGKKIHEYDEIGHLEGKPVIIEVKSGKLKYYHHKITRGLLLAQNLFYDQDDIYHLCFAPSRYQSQGKINKIESIDNSFFIDTKWATKQIDRAVMKLLNR